MPSKAIHYPGGFGHKVVSVKPKYTKDTVVYRGKMQQVNF